MAIGGGVLCIYPIAENVGLKLRQQRLCWLKKSKVKWLLVQTLKVQTGALLPYVLSKVSYIWCVIGKH